MAVAMAMAMVMVMTARWDSLSDGGGAIVRKLERLALSTPNAFSRRGLFRLCFRAMLSAEMTQRGAQRFESRLTFEVSWTEVAPGTATERAVELWISQVM